MEKDPVTAPLINSASTTGWLGPGRHAIGSSAWGGSYGFNAIVDINYTYPGKPEPPEYTNWETKADTKLLQAAFADFEPRFRKTLEFVKEGECRLWRILMLPDLKTWVSASGKVVLAGDAAHAMCPYMAQVSSLLPAEITSLWYNENSTKPGSGDGSRGQCNLGRVCSQGRNRGPTTARDASL